MASKIEEPIPYIKQERKWLIQCKRYIKKHLEINMINSFLCQCKEHKPDSVLLMITNTLKPSIKDWLEKVKHEFSFKIYIWEENDLLRVINDNKAHFYNQFPILFSFKEPVEMYAINMGDFYFGIDEIEEVELRALNCSNVEAALEKVREFIAFIKANDININ